LLWNQPTTPIAFPSNFHRGCGYIRFTGKLRSYFGSLLTNNPILISFFPTYALHPTSISVLCTIFTLFLTQKLPRHCLCYCWFQIRLCQFHSYGYFFSQYPSSSARSKLLGWSRYSLNYQHHLSSKFPSLASNSATNQF